MLAEGSVDPTPPPPVEPEIAGEEGATTHGATLLPAGIENAVEESVIRFAMMVLPVEVA